MKKFLALFMVLGLLISFSNSFAQKIGYVDFQMILNKSNIGKRYMKKLEPKKRRAEGQINKINAQMKKLFKELQSPVLSDNVKKQKYGKLQKLDMQRKQIFLSFQKEKMKVERELVGKIAKVIKEYAEKNRFDLILTGGFERGILYIGNSINITQDLLNYINKKLR